MKKFFTKILAYAFVVIALTAAIILFCAPRYWNSRIPVMKGKMLQSAGDSISVVLGSSHALFGINTKAIAKDCYNLASISQSLFEDYQLLKVAAKDRKIKFVILPISYFSNFHRLLSSPVRGEAIRVHDYEKAFDLRYERNKTYYLNQITLLGQISKVVFEGAQAERKLDDQGNLLAVCDSTVHDLGDSTHAFENHNMQKDFSRPNEYLDSIADFCARLQVPLYVVVFPFSNGYLNEVKRSGPAFETYLQGIRANANNRYHFYDGRNFFPYDQPRYFKDADHLSPCGRDIFSRFIADSILRQPVIPAKF